MSFLFGSEITNQVYMAVKGKQRNCSAARALEVAQATLDKLAEHALADGYADVRLGDGTVLTIVARRPE